MSLLQEDNITTNDDWQADKSLAETNLHMLENDILCDVTFKTGENLTEIKAHKFILVSRSRVFEAMFCGALAEPEASVTIPDIEADIFKMLLT